MPEDKKDEVLPQSLTPEEMEQQKADTEKVIVNEKVIARFAEIIPSAQLGIFTPELREAIEKAQATLGSRRGLSAAPATDQATSRQSGRRNRLKLDVEQQADWLRCALLGPGKATPDEHLDADGLVTQALTVTSGSAGGYLLPEDFIAEIEKKEDEPQVVWPLIRVRKTSLHSIVKPKYTSYPSSNKGPAAKAGSATSSDEITETEPVYGELTWTPRYFDARDLIKLDMLEDSPIDVMDELQWAIADAFSIDHEREPIIGTGAGSSRPTGILNSSSGISTVAMGGTLTLTTLLDTFVSEIPQRYRARATLLMNGALLFKVVRMLAENVRSAQFLVNKLPRLEESSYVHDGKIIGGDFSRYVVYINRQMYVVSADVPSKFAKDISFIEKWDGQVVLADAFRIATGVTY